MDGGITIEILYKPANLGILSLLSPDVVAGKIDGTIGMEVVPTFKRQCTLFKNLSI